MAVAPEAMAVTGASWKSVSPEPVWPEPLPPQHMTASPTSAQVWEPAASTALAPAAMAVTGVRSASER